MGAEDAAYMAGLLDGEGYFTLQKKSKPSRGYANSSWELSITVASTTKTLLEEVSIMVPWGGGTVGFTSRILKGRQKPAWRIKWTGSACVELAKAIHPYIRLKRRHVELMLMVASAKKSAQSERCGRGSPYPLWIEQLHQSVFEEFREINRRGQDNEPIQNAIEDRKAA